MKKLVYWYLGFTVFVIMMCNTVSDNKPYVKSIDNVEPIPKMCDLRLTPTVSVSSNSTTDAFKSYVSGYDAMCRDTEQLSLDTEHYLISDGFRVDVTKQKCIKSSDTMRIVNCLPSYSVDIWNKDNYYWANCYSGEEESGWCHLTPASMSDACYVFLKYQLGVEDNFNFLSDIIKSFDLDECKCSEIKDGYMVSAPVSIDLLDKLKPVYMNDGVLANSYVHVYVSHDGLILSVYYLYEGSDVEQEVYTYKLKLSGDTLSIPEDVSSGVESEAFYEFYESIMR